MLMEKLKNKERILISGTYNFYNYGIGLVKLNFMGGAIYV